VPFGDRREAGRRLASALEHLRDGSPVVLGLPRGGVLVAAEVARALGAQLDVLVVRKLGAPGRRELAMGAIAEGDGLVLNREVIDRLGIAEDQIAATLDAERAELERRVERYRGGRDPIPVEGRIVIVVDDGLATGASAAAAVRAARARGAARVILAVPVASPEGMHSLSQEADEVVAVEVPDELWAIGAWYRDFSQTSDEEVIDALGGTTGSTEHRAAAIRAGEVTLPGDLTVPAGATGIVIFAHGSGSSHLSPRNIEVARVLHEGGFATLLFDLLTPSEEQIRLNVFDVPLLAERLEAATEWARAHAPGMPVGYFGASTGAAAALWAAAGTPDVAAVVSRGGRPDLAMTRLDRVRAPTLLIVGGLDTEVLVLNEKARAAMNCPTALEVIPGATHLFQEPGALENVATRARAWFGRWLAGDGLRRSGSDRP